MVINKMEIKDLIIVGAGPAGLSAAIYAARYKLNFTLFSKQFGGMITESDRVENWPGEKRIKGLDLVNKFKEHALNFGTEIIDERVEKVEKTDFGFKINNNYKSKTILIAQGTEKRKLNIKGEKEFLGRGVSYCATCDAAFFKDKVVAVVGGSDAALIAALLLSEYAKKVHIVYRREKFFRAEPVWIEKVENNKKIEPVFNSNIREIKGSDKIEKIVLDSGKELPVDGVFVEIGSIPNIELAKQLNLNLDKGHIVVDKFQRTSLPGVFAAGDVTNNPLKQAITAAAEGAVAANSAYEQIVGDRKI
jgi:thioredoxin reductase (NADPH)